MKNLTVAIMAMAILSSCASFKRQADWSKGQKIAEVSWQALNVIDSVQTIKIAKNPDEFYERNFLYGRHPSVGRVVALKAGSAILHPIITHYLPEDWRKYWLGVTIGLGAGCVVNNIIVMGF